MTPTVTVLQGDCLEQMPKLEAGSVDAIVTDPPYHLTTGKKGGRGPASENLNHPGGRSKITTGFMGKAWDGGDVAFRSETWLEALRVCKPGAFLLAFGGTRTFHRLACAIEDAGWEIRDTIMWVYGSGFPKSHNLEGEWEGWGTALKPAWEPIVVARKPVVGTVAENVQEHGTGAMNIDACRIPANGDKLNGGRVSTDSDGWDRPWKHDQQAIEACRERGAAAVAKSESLGRWPANVIHDGSEEVVSAFPKTESGQPCGVKAGGRLNVFGEFAGGIPVTGFGDSGSAARFFYCAKACGTERGDGNDHPTVKPLALMSYLVRLVCRPGGVVLDPFAGSGSTGTAAIENGCSAILIELNPAYCELIKQRTNVTPGLGF